jgi:hypothetical protein
MGIYINYKGKLRSPSLVHELTAELKDIAEIMEWPYEVRDDDWSKPSTMRFENNLPTGEAYLKGIIFKPLPHYDLVTMTFDCNGEMHSEFSLAWKEAGLDEEIENWHFSKTSNAPDYVHVGVCKLLRHLEKKYFEVLQVKDDTGYWETGDEKALAQSQDIMRILVGAIRSAADKNGVDFLNKLGLQLKEGSRLEPL